MSGSLLPTWVQLFRNLLCVVKALLPADSAAVTLKLALLFTGQGSHSPAVLTSSSSPLVEITVFEFLICILQWAGAVFCWKSCVISLWGSFCQHRNCASLLRSLRRYRWDNRAKFNAIQLLKRVYDGEDSRAMTRLISGLCDAAVGVSFVFLALNNMHIRGPTHPKPVIDALIVMQICLLFSLHLMLASLFLRNGRLSQCFGLKQIIIPNKTAEYAVFTRKYDSVDRAVDLNDLLGKARQVECYEGHELDAISVLAGAGRAVEDLTGSINSSEYSYRLMPDGVSDSKTTEHLEVLRCLFEQSSSSQQAVSDPSAAAKKYALRDVFRRIDSLSERETRLWWYEAGLLLLNVIAGWAYLMAILSYYCPTQVMPGNTFLGGLVRAAVLYLPDHDADWFGNFTGSMDRSIYPCALAYMDGIVT